MATRKHTPFVQLDLPFGPHEAWKPVPGYEGLYEVSNLGRVRGLDRVEQCGDRRRRRKGRVLRAYTSFGYKRVCLSTDGKGLKFMVHTLVLSAFVGPRQEGFQANHLDGNKANNVLDNLEWVTQSENILHAFATGLSGRGERHHQARLTNEQVLEIRAMSAQGATRRDLVLSFGIPYFTLRDILTGKNWRHLL